MPSDRGEKERLDVAAGVLPGDDEKDVAADEDERREELQRREAEEDGKRLVERRDPEDVGALDGDVAPGPRMRREGRTGGFVSIRTAATFICLLPAWISVSTV